MVGIVADLVVILFIISFAAFGRLRGFSSMVINLFSIVIAIIVALILVNPVTNYVKDHTKIDDKMKSKISSSMPLNDTDVGIEPSEKLPKKLQEYIKETSKKAEKSKEETLDIVSTELTDKILTICVGLAIFLIVRAILLIIKLLSHFIKKLPVIGTIDRTGGLICGIIEAIFILYILLALLSVIAPLISNENVLDCINSSYLVKYMYNNNILLGKFED